MRIFVTGGSGFVGGAAIARLVAEGHSIGAMSRSERSDVKLSALGASPVRCDLDTLAAEHIGEAECVIHCAAFVEAWGPPDAWYRGNVLGTANVLKAAEQAGAARFIHIGTEAAIVHGQDVDHADETVPLAPHSLFPYCATKAMAERLVLDANRDGFTTIVLRPRMIWGPGDQTIAPELRKMAEAGSFAWIDGGKAVTSTTHIDNLVEAIVLALKKGRGGEAYFVLDDGDRPMREVLGGIAASLGFTLPDRNAPSALLMPVAGACERIWRLFNLKSAPPITRHAVMVMARRCTLVDAKARDELGYRPVIGFEEGLEKLKQSA